MKSRKPSLHEQQKHADELLKNEIITRKACLKTALSKVEDLVKKIMAGDVSEKTREELHEQEQIARNIVAWVKSHEKVA